MANNQKEQSECSKLGFPELSDRQCGTITGGTYYQQGTNLHSTRTTMLGGQNPVPQGTTVLGINSYHLVTKNGIPVTSSGQPVTDSQVARSTNRRGDVSIPLDN